MTSKTIKIRPPDFLLFFATISLVAIGIVMIFSASSVKSGTMSMFNYDPYYFLKRQIIWALTGLILMLLVIKLDLKILRHASPYILILSWIFLVLVLVPGIGIKINGARRWLGIGVFSIQPSEFAKLSLIFYMATFLAKRRKGLHGFWKDFLPALLIAIPGMALIEFEPDMGTAILLGVTTFAMLFLAGARLPHMGILLISIIPAVTAMIISKGYRFRRLLAFTNPWKDPEDSGYHIIQSLLALGAGGLLGVGLGRSRQKFFYLPEQHTDYIYAIIGEELGLIGGIIILALLLFLCYRAFKIFKDSPEFFSTLLAGGIASMFSFQTILNLGVVTNLLPPTGVPLPFLSFGGSSLVCNLIAVGLLLNISRTSCKSKMEESENYEKQNVDGNNRNKHIVPVKLIEYEKPYVEDPVGLKTPV